MAAKKTRLKNNTQRKIHRAAYNKGHNAARRHYEKKIEEILRAQQEVSGDTEIKLGDIHPSGMAADNVVTRSIKEDDAVDTLMRRLRTGKVIFSITFDGY